MHEIGFFEIGRHFSKHLTVGDADIDGKAERFFYLHTDMFGSVFRGWEMFPDWVIVHVTFIDADLFNIRTDIGKKLHQLMASLIV